MKTRDMQWFDEQYAALASEGKSWGSAQMYQNKCACLQWCFTSQGLLPTASILDLGCGAGELAILLAENGFPNVDGIDLSAVAIKKAQSIASGRFQVLDFARPCRFEHAYDCLFDTDCFQMVVEPERRAEFLANVAANLKPGGVFLTGVNSSPKGADPRIVVEEHVQYWWPTTEAFVEEVCGAGFRVVAQRDLPPRNKKACDRWSELVFIPMGNQADPRDAAPLAQ